MHCASRSSSPPSARPSALPPPSPPPSPQPQPQPRPQPRPQPQPPGPLPALLCRCVCRHICGVSRYICVRANLHFGRRKDLPERRLHCGRGKSPHVCSAPRYCFRTAQPADFRCNSTTRAATGRPPPTVSGASRLGLAVARSAARTARQFAALERLAVTWRGAIPPTVLVAGTLSGSELLRPRIQLSKPTLVSPRGRLAGAVVFACAPLVARGEDAVSCVPRAGDGSHTTMGGGPRIAFDSRRFEIVAVIQHLEPAPVRSRGSTEDHGLCARGGTRHSPQLAFPRAGCS